MKVHSHYENLKVTRDAPPEVIRAAYRSLSQKHHPDRNPESIEANRIMAILNVAFETLSDPKKRKEHDEWIEMSETTYSTEQAQKSESNSSTRNRAFTINEEKLRNASNSRQSTSYKYAKDFARILSDPNISFFRKIKHILAHITRNWLWYGIGMLLIFGLANEEKNTELLDSKPYKTTPTSESYENSAVPSLYKSAPAPKLAGAVAYSRPNRDPNGQPWPMSSDYIRGHQILHNDGLSTVTIDNSKNDSDVFVKLVSLNTPKAFPVREFFISSHGRFSLSQVTAGNYDIRYRDLSTGGLSRSERFTLAETPTYNGTQFSNITMTLYKVSNGNMQTYGLTENEF